MTEGGAGWTLEEGLLFASEPKLAEHWEAWRARFMAGGKDVDRAEAADLRERMEMSFLAAMRDGALSAWGATGGEQIEIPARVWVETTLLDWERSAITVRDMGRIKDVRLVPWLHLPDIATRLHGLALHEAFRRYVRNDLEVADRLRWAAIAFVGKYNASCREVKDGWFTSATRLWPASLDDYDMAVEWLDVFEGTYASLEPARKKGSLDWYATKTPKDCEAFARIRAAETVIRDRFDRLLTPLRLGEVEALGQIRDGSAPAVVAQGIWTRPRTRIDFVDGELHRMVSAEVRLNQQTGHYTLMETTSLEWTGLTLRLAAGAAKPAIKPAFEPKDKGGRRNDTIGRRFTIASSRKSASKDSLPAGLVRRSSR